MIKVFGNDQTSEYIAAVTIANLAGSAWPWLKEDNESFLYLVPSVQCHGQNPKDIDIVLLGYFFDQNASKFSPHGLLTLNNGTSIATSKVQVQSLCLTIEVKDHSPEMVRFVGTRVDVEYTFRGEKRWHSATDQSHSQLYSFLNYLKSRGIKYPPRVTNLIWLRNVSGHELPAPPHNILHSKITWNGLLHTAASTSQITGCDGDYIFSALTRRDYDLETVVQAITEELLPTALDRKKMDAMVRSPKNYDWYQYVGKKQIVFHGHGGTGKTMVLLQVANTACSEGDRVLILTYNKALVADLRRLMSLAGVSDDIASGTIKVQTVHSFFSILLKDAGIIKHQKEDFYENYFTNLEFLREWLLIDNVVVATDENHISEISRQLEWDLILIDEGQDWPELERDVLRLAYDNFRLIVVDGIDQLIRGQKPCDWRNGLKGDHYVNVDLKSGLRMKRNLAFFANSIALKLGLRGWSLLENKEALGGRIIIVEGSYFDYPELHDTIILNAKNLHNEPVDILACVPPSLAKKSEKDDYIISKVAHGFQSLNQLIWDGTDNDVRKTYPTKLEQLRVVQYDSCRGLEGWVTLNLGLDEFYQWKYNSWESTEETEPGIFEDDVHTAERFVARWIMIALTRAIDTIVIEVSKSSSKLKTHLKELQKGSCGDFIEWYVKSNN
jgi:hypothetical protein